MIQDITPQIFHNEYIWKEPETEDYIMVFSQNRILINMNGNRDHTFPTMADVGQYSRNADGKVFPYQYLFCIGRENYFLYRNFDHAENIADRNEAVYKMENLSLVRGRLSKEVCFAVYTAYHLYCWYRDNQFCGRCGRKVQPDRKERMLYCTKCGNQIYPKIAPAVITAVTDGDRILLSKYADREYKRYALIAGFTEIGETAEETVRREVKEEVGLNVKNIRYYKTQPWGIASNLLIGYFAELDGDDTIRLDHNELAAAEWMHRQDLKNVDDGISLTREMMRVFSEGREPVN